jgi:hypothetical protein
MERLRFKFFSLATMLAISSVAFIRIAAVVAATSVVAAAQQPSDMVQIQPTSPLPRPRGNDLLAGKAVQLNLNLRYNLISADNAVLPIYVDEFPASAGGCRGAIHATNGGTFIQIKRSAGGSPWMAQSVVWHGNAPVYRQTGLRCNWI